MLNTPCLLLDITSSIYEINRAKFKHIHSLVPGCVYKSVNLKFVAFWRETCANVREASARAAGKENFLRPKLVAMLKYCKNTLNMAEIFA